ncbi:TIGR02234 family membrane protein [Corynebacterium hansenii]|uniref:TIGR02234 family membrane protein n=1 Tax=Corynebacterium hansenii TaxID=394964 RepID=A0ABV7ZPC6_9CORY|nr:TIGR02234 family membrane protein [Corynebacterium hansenii]WJZ00216.1 Tryptophan-associated transmembrane protein [Corynebacterium hansenii]
MTEPQGKREPEQMSGQRGEQVPEQDGGAKKTDRRPGAALALILASAIGLWLAGRAAWLTVTTFDDKSGEAVNDLVGATWAPETTALALALAAAVAATLIMGGLGRRVVGGLAAVIAAAAAWSPLQLLTAGADPKRALDLLSSGAATQRANAPVTVSDWAQIQNLETHSLGPVVSVIVAALGVLGGVLLLVRPGGTVAKRRSGAYETPEVRRERVRDDLSREPASGRVMWDALDAGVDPTDTDPADSDPAPGSTDTGAADSDPAPGGGRTDR